MSGRDEGGWILYGFPWRMLLAVPWLLTAVVVVVAVASADSKPSWFGSWALVWFGLLLVTILLIKLFPWNLPLQRGSRSSEQLAFERRRRRASCRAIGVGVAAAAGWAFQQLSEDLD